MKFKCQPMNGQKKGSFFDSLSLILIPLLVSLVLIIVGFAFNQVNEQLQIAKASDSTINYSANLFDKNTQRYNSYNNVTALLIIFGVWLLTLILSFLLGNNPIFLIIYVMSSIALFFIAIAFNIFYTDFLESAIMTSMSDKMPAIAWYMRNSLWINIFFIVTNGLALYLKRSFSNA